MAWFEPTRITERGVFRILVGGFALVLALLGIAGYVAVRGTRALEKDAIDAGREQLAMARLLNDVQAGQNTLAAILHKLAPGQEPPNRNQLLQELERADQALTGLAESASNTPEAAQWRDLEREVRVFSAGVRKAIRGSSIKAAKDLVPLLEQHDRVVRIEQQLLLGSEKRMEQTEHAIEVESRELAENSRVLLGACLILALLCTVLTLFFARRSIRKIENQASELSRVSWHMLQDQESLARRFSHELHDELGQSLAAVKANLNLGKPSDWAARRADCANLVDAAIANVRELSQLLHPVILDDFGLDAGLRWLTEGFEQRTGISTRYVSDFNLRLRDDVETHFFRIAQEALTNIARHSNASAVRVELSELHGVLSMTVEDNGRGLDGVQLKQPSIGMTGMRARAKEVGATLHFEQSDIGTAKGKGLRVAVHVPLQAVLNPEEANEKANLAG